jgi:hypothetical protein
MVSKYQLNVLAPNVRNNMLIQFTIGLGLLEFACHFAAALCYMWIGFVLKNDDISPFLFASVFVAAIVLNIIGASL